MTQTSVRELFDLSGCVAVVTGGTRGLGRDMAEALAEGGADVIVTSRSGERASEAARELASEHDVEALGLALDQRFAERVGEFAERATSWKGHVDVLVNNAGGGSGDSAGDLFERPLADIRAMIEVNLLGVLYCCREIGRHMVDRRAGRIVNIASIAAIVGRDRSIYLANGVNEQPVDYAAAKAGVLGLTRDLAAKLAPHGVTVNAISPGGFDKGHLPEAFVDAYAARTALGRMGELGSDIKGICTYLASPASRYVTGQNFVVDGGFSLWK